MKIAFYTLGCKVNQYETQGLKEIFSARGYEIAESAEEEADVYVVNTCTVTGLSDRKSRQYIRRMKKRNPNAITAVIGCYAQISPDEVSAVEGVDIVAGTNEKSRLPELIEQWKEEHQQIRYVLEYEQLGECFEDMGIITSMESRTRAFIKVQEGCNRFCSYCVIPYARGMVRSRPKEDVLKEAQALIDSGFKELVLTGINTALYGAEPGFPKEESGLTGVEILIDAISQLEGDFRIRLSSLEPTVVNGEYVKRLLKYDKLCHHLHLSAQSGSDNVLSAMNRRYDRGEYLDIVRVLKEADPGYGISTDLIAGFPGETEADHQDSVRLIDEAGFYKVHAFTYSKRPGTKAAEMKGHLAPLVKKRRTQELIEAGDTAAKRFAAMCVGQTRQVLFEERDSDSGLWRGHADNFLQVYLDSPEDLDGKLMTVQLTEVFKDGVKGKA
ncbi:MAG: tRNA (N(6)-L-threonylcarbamoyladenosine(37)-C(2))-methylthiotransferase MtaB [Firmicutes bacterium]|nr:tRNA (N(6)-L-threonylcarbamoyladenosine(37)-C(2))-methylthiotransferase MtaB [Bacillota bacterium]